MNALLARLAAEHTLDELFDLAEPLTNYLHAHRDAHPTAVPSTCAPSPDLDTCPHCRQPEEPTRHLACSRCGSTDIAEIDVAWRTNTAHIEPLETHEDGPGFVAHWSTGDSQFDGVAYMCAGCQRPLSLPMSLCEEGSYS